ncbi:MAG: NrdH-redoxin [Salinivirgaceae bacterium]|nr:MAG: NrdH-redoxin [Salinivirgaceae bacterium]
MYTTPTCTYCTSLKNYLNDKSVSYTEIDVSKDHQAAEEMVKRSGQQGVPQTVINGQVVIGFDRAKINQLLNIE